MTRQRKSSEKAAQGQGKAVANIGSQSLKHEICPTHDDWSPNMILSNAFENCPVIESPVKLNLQHHDSPTAHRVDEHLLIKTLRSDPRLRKPGWADWVRHAPLDPSGPAAKHLRPLHQAGQRRELTEVVPREAASGRRLIPSERIG